MRDHLGNPFQSGRPEFAKGVLLLDDCSGTFTWRPAGTGGDDVHEYLAAAAYYGAQGLHLKTRTTGAAADDQVTVWKSLELPESGLVVMRARVAYLVKANVKRIYLGAIIMDGAKVWYGRLLWYVATDTVKYMTAVAAETTLTGLGVPNNVEVFVLLELVMDSKRGCYVSCTFNGQCTDLANVPMYHAADLAKRELAMEISCMSVAANPAEIYGDLMYCGDTYDV